MAFEWHPALNAVLNATSAVLLTAGWWAIKTQRRERHRKLMLAAFTTSSVFLTSYVIRFLTTGAHKYPGTGIDKYVYLVILIGHMILAVVLVPMALRALQLALRGRFPEHRRVVRYAWPIWMIVSLSGVVVYLMLYHLAPALH